MKEEIKRFLNEHASSLKAEFDSKIIKTSLPILGVKMSELEKFARNLVREGVKISDIELSTHEEVILRGMVIGYSNLSPKEKIEQLEKIFPHFDNWAVVDTIVPRLKGLENQGEWFEELLGREGEFVKRTGIVCLMKYSLAKDLKHVVEVLSKVQDDKFYVQMGISWCYSEAFIRDFEYMKGFITTISNKFIRNKSIQKACESFRLTKEQKGEIRCLKI